MRSVMTFLALLLCFTSAAVDLPLASQQSAGSRFAFDQSIGFLPYGGYGREALHAWKKRSAAPTRAAAARELAGDPDPRSGHALAKVVSDKDWSVRAAAIEAIAKRGDPALLVDIVPAMSDRKDVVRYSAAAGVLRLGRIAQENGSRSH
jgi:HEAT repeat protein